MAAAVHKLWGCLVKDVPFNNDYSQLEFQLKRPVRVTSASIQGSKSNIASTETRVYVIGIAEDDEHLQIAELSAKQPRVNLDIVFQAGDTIAFFKSSFSNNVQLMGYYLDDCDECTGKNLKKKDEEEIDRIKTGVEELLKGKDTTVKDLYNQVRELRVKLQQIETLLKPDV